MRLLSSNAALILSAFLAAPTEPRYGYELMQETGIKSGSLYPVLGRFERLGWITCQAEESVDHRPPRRLYTLVASSTGDAQAALDRFLDAKVAPAERAQWGLA
jgi:DNA-binding PadR family transcriptional regulator